MRLLLLPIVVLAGCGPSEKQILSTLEVSDRVVAELPLEMTDRGMLVVIRDTTPGADAIRTIINRSLVPRRLLRHRVARGDTFELGVGPQGNGMMQNLPGLGYIAYDGDRGRINFEVARREGLRVTEIRRSEEGDRRTHAAFAYSLVPTLPGLDIEPRPRADSGAIVFDEQAGEWEIDRASSALESDLRQVAAWLENVPASPPDRR